MSTATAASSSPLPPQRRNTAIPFTPAQPGALPHGIQSVAPVIPPLPARGAEADVAALGLRASSASRKARQRSLGAEVPGADGIRDAVPWHPAGSGASSGSRPPIELWAKASSDVLPPVARLREGRGVLAAHLAAQQLAAARASPPTSATSTSIAAGSASDPAG